MYACSEREFSEMIVCGNTDFRGGHNMERIAPQYSEGFSEESLTEGEGSTRTCLERSFCANSDLFPHYFSKGLRSLPDEVYRLQAEYYRSKDFFQE